jgi:(E)-4-hydroxy-3-methylbut-2-enyl-diphosphate synthase
MNRLLTKAIKVGNLTIGGSNTVVIQSMTNTKTANVVDTVKQINDLEQAGCQLVRVAVFDREDALALKEIKSKINIPLAADIHFDYRLALLAIEAGVDKLRINPGNIGTLDRIVKVVNACKEKQIPIRIGVNGGSLERDILEKYGHPTPEALVESAKRHVDILESLDFYDIIISIKTSDTFNTIEAYRLASKTFPYPLHIGVTEAGTALGGTVKSSYALGTLLAEGIGSTIRVSLTADPIEEIRVAKDLLSIFNLYTKPKLTSCPTCGRLQYDMFPIVNEIEEYLNTLNSDIKVAIMGCAVNGPGEAKEADIGIAGGKSQALLFKSGKVVRSIKQEDIVVELKKEIDALIKQRNLS